MQHISLPIKTLSPVAIRSDHAEGGSATASYIPGATLLGSLAAAHRMLWPERQDEFTRLFLSEQIFFPYLYPALFKESSSANLHKSNLPVMPLPKTAQNCKRFSGFKPLKGEKTDDDRHGIRDSLLDWVVFSLLNNEQHAVPALLASLDQRALCTNCNQVMDHINGYYRRDGRNPKLRMIANTSKRLQTRTGINRDWGVVEESILYNREVFDEDMLFWGDLILPDELASIFLNFLEEAIREKVIRIGTGRTRGLGLVDLVSDISKLRFEREDINTFGARLNAFNTTIKQQAEKMGVKKETLDPLYFFAVTLYSPTILCDSFLRYYKTLDGVTLSKELGYPPGTCKKIYHSTGVKCITGWNELWGTPKTNDYAIEIGSTFVFACTQKQDKGFLQALYTLEENGIGRRRSEGFGRICISDPFHLEGEQL
jgi:CRISPR-associated Csx10 family RAMP protein